MTDLNDFAHELSDILDEYADECGEAVEEAVTEVTKEVRKKVRRNAVQLFGSGKYSRGWQYKIQKDQLDNAVTGTIYNGGTHGGLTQLLEKPHALRGGGRWNPPAKHIEPVEQEIDRELLAEVKNRL